LAANLAAGLYARTKSEVVVAEMLPGQGSLNLELGLESRKGLVDILSMAKVADITKEAVLEVLTTHGSGIEVLASSDRPRDMHLTSQLANYQAMISRLATVARFIVLDLGVGIQPFTPKILPMCDEIMIVLEGVPNTIIHTKSLIEDITSFGVHKRSINIILNNRVRSDTQLPSSQVQTNLDHEIISTLTPAPELFVQAARMQMPAVLCQPDSLTTRQVNKLVDFFLEREALPR
jgi:Flp pilus assembly CpaE family ATPase